MLIFESATNYTATGGEMMEVLPGNVKTTLSLSGWCVRRLPVSRHPPCPRRSLHLLMLPFHASLPLSLPSRPFCSADNKLVLELGLKSTKLGAADMPHEPSVKHGSEVRGSGLGLARVGLKVHESGVNRNVQLHVITLLSWPP